MPRTVCRSKKSGHFVKKWACKSFRKSKVAVRRRKGPQFLLDLA